MPKLEGVVRMLDKGERFSAEEIRDAISTAVRDASQSNIDITDAQLGRHIVAELQSIEKRQAKSRNTLFTHVGTILGGLAEAVSELDEQLGKLDKALNGSTEVLSGDVKASVSELHKAVQSAADRNTAAVNKVEKMVTKLPTRLPAPVPVNLSPVIDTLTVIMERLQEPMVIEDRPPQEWVFDVEYEDFSDKVKQIHARQVV